MVPAGELNKRVVIESATYTVAANGERVPTWGTWRTRWAKIEPLGSGEQAVGNGYAHVVTHRVTIRHLDGVSPTFRVRYGTRVLSVAGVLNPDEANEDTLLDCAEVS